MTEQPGRLAAYWERKLDKMDERELRHSRRLPGWRTRRRRRTLTAVLALADLVLITGAAVFTTADDRLFGTLWAAGIVLGGTTFVLLRILTGRMSGGSRGCWTNASASGATASPTSASSSSAT
ncbi:hypothetical protein Amsp01_013950 [Amycolatopsis sp. NBRC 101858]|uniref:hypothetical protein n=1 Tax=Amycolatopsis sp. NBRC 101858 TaxID=3032200 RepID=UPI00249F9597|nr:hypothetical protein [Amycolatopsis sp. NBRC 101858]GLY35371.1 hypothetical protein Amsp01_013950 [Amycolatopsis sp. NBRC 101858]